MRVVLGEKKNKKIITWVIEDGRGLGLVQLVVDYFKRSGQLLVHIVCIAHTQNAKIKIETNPTHKQGQ